MGMREDGCDGNVIKKYHPAIVSLYPRPAHDGIWHRTHRLSKHTSLSSINRDRGSHSKLIVRGTISLDSEKINIPKYF